MTRLWKSQTDFHSRLEISHRPRDSHIPTSRFLSCFRRRRRMNPPSGGPLSERRTGLLSERRHHGQRGNDLLARVVKSTVGCAAGIGGRPASDPRYFLGGMSVGTKSRCRERGVADSRPRCSGLTWQGGQATARDPRFAIPRTGPEPESPVPKTKSPRHPKMTRALLGRNTPGSDLLSHALAHAVPSAVEGLTSVFGMGTGVTPLL